MQIGMFYLPTFMGMLIQFFADYIKHRLTAKSRHGTHSPFVYKLVDKVIYDFSAKKVYEAIENEQKKLLNDDLGVVNKRLAQLIYRLVNNHPAQTIILLGAKNVSINQYISVANAEAKVITEEVRSIEPIDIAYLDGNRSKETTLNYFEYCLPNVHKGTLLIIKDIYANKGMKAAWREVKAHDRVRVTIDLFWIGLVYFKQDQVKEHFKIKF